MKRNGTLLSFFSKTTKSKSTDTAEFSSSSLSQIKQNNIDNSESKRKKLTLQSQSQDNLNTLFPNEVFEVLLETNDLNNLQPQMEVNVKNHETDKELLTSEPPDCWDNNQVKYFTEEYPWLYFNRKKNRM